MADFQKEQEALFEVLLTRVADFYDRDYQPNKQSIPYVRFVDTAACLQKHVDSDAVDRIGLWLAENDIVECSEFKTGTTAIALAGRTGGNKICVVRVPLHFEAAEHRRADHIRDDHPANMQPLKNEQGEFLALPYREGSRIELLPLMRSTDLGNFPIIESMHADMGLHYPGINVREFALLPNGAFLGLDPDMLKRNTQIAFQSDQARQAKVNERFPLLEDFSWIRNGKPVQEIFFPPGYLSSPSPPQPVAKGAGPQTQTLS